MGWVWDVELVKVGRKDAAWMTLQPALVQGTDGLMVKSLCLRVEEDISFLSRNFRPEMKTFYPCVQFTAHYHVAVHMECTRA